MELVINRANLDNLSKTGLLREFSAFLHYKSVVKKGHFYDYSPASLSRLMNLSAPRVKQHIRRFLALGWCVLSSRGTLSFLGVEKTQPADLKVRIKARISLEGGVKGIMDKLYLLILQHKGQQFEWLKGLARVNKSSSSLIKKGIKTDEFGRPLAPDQNAKFQVSIRKIAEWFGCSIGKASGIIKTLKLSGLIKCFSPGRTVVAMTRCKYQLEFLDFSYYHQGRAVKVHCNYYVFD